MLFLKTKAQSLEPYVLCLKSYVKTSLVPARPGWVILLPVVVYKYDSTALSIPKKLPSIEAVYDLSGYNGSPLVNRHGRLGSRTVHHLI